MIVFCSDKYNELQEILETSLSSNDYNEWVRFLDSENSSFVDGFLNFLTHHQQKKILKEFGFNNIKEWLMSANKWTNQILDPRNDSSPEALVLYQLWSQICNKLTHSVRQSRLIADIPQKGGILCYLGGLSTCVVFKYQIISDHPTFEIIDVIDNPMSAFDFWGIINLTGVKERNILKEILSTGHKLIFHRGLLIHVDRRKDTEVFGPSIDTILLAEVLTQQVFEMNNCKVEKALEIGCGNGMLTVAMATNCNTLKTLHSIDLNFNSVVCCHRNLKGNLTSYKYDNLNLHLLYGKFNGNILNTKYDLIVCNPPYIPFMEQSLKSFHKKKDYFEAIGGLSLIDQILVSLHSMLSDEGKLLILVSNLSLENTIEMIPNGFTYELIFQDGFEVLFDVEAVLNNNDWLQFLLQTKDLVEKGNMYYHKLFPIWIYKKRTEDVT